jgi:hypothetical protein
MFSLRSLGTAGLMLGLTALVPTTAKADRVRNERNDHFERRDVRVERHDDHRGWNDHRDVHVDRDRVRIEIAPPPIYIDRDFDTTVGLSQVPACVLDTVNYQRRGPIDSIEYIRRGGSEFYRFVVDSPTGHLDMRVDLAGRLMSINPC